MRARDIQYAVAVGGRVPQQPAGQLLHLAIMHSSALPPNGYGDGLSRSSDGGHTEVSKSARVAGATNEASLLQLFLALVIVPVNDHAAS